MRSTEERLVTLAVQAHKGYIPFKLNDHDVEDDVTITQENLNTQKKKTLRGKFTIYLRENQVDKEFSLLWPSEDNIYLRREV